MGATSKEIWNSLFDDTLEKFMSESILVRDLAMILHVMTLKFNELRNNVLVLQDTNEEQRRAIESYSKQNCNCSRRYTRLEDSDLTKVTGITKLQDEIIIISQDSPDLKNKNIINLDCTPKIEEKTMMNDTIFENSPNFLDDDIFNQHISELDLDNLENNRSIINDTVIVEKSNSIKDKGLSPKLNKKKSISHALRSKLSKSITPINSLESSRSNERTPIKNNDDFSVICETPDLLDDISKRFRPNKLMMSNNNNDIQVLKTRCPNTPEKQTNNRKSEKRSLDRDETVINPGGSKNCSDDEMDIDVLLSALNKTPHATQKKKSKPSVKENIFETSYKSLPIEKKLGPKYYKEVVRKKAEREKLPGWDCEDCEKYYKNMDLNESERKKIMNHCSRHRSKQAFREIFTPEGYWNPDFTIQSQNP